MIETLCPGCAASQDRPASAKPASDDDFVICLGCGNVSAWLPPPSRGPVRLVLHPLGTARARLELRRGGRTLAVLGKRTGARWELDANHEASLLQVLPRLEARSRRNGKRLASGLGAESSLPGLHRADGNRQRTGGPPP